VAFFSIDFPNSQRSVLVFALAGSVAPMSVHFSVASGASCVRQGCNREIAFYKATVIAQGCDIIRRELGLPAAYMPAADPMLLIDVVP
jgi:hypothetical protein